MRRVTLLLLLCATVGEARKPPARPASAKTSARKAAATPAQPSAEALIREGEKLYQSGKYQEAAQVLIRANELQPNPRLTYNIARAYDQAGALELALGQYQQYVSSQEGTDPVLLKRSALAMERLRGLLAKQQQTQAQTDAERQRLEAERKQAEARAQADAQAAERVRQESEARKQALELSARKSYQASKTGALVVGAVGAAGVVSGVVFGVLALSTRQTRLTASLDQKDPLLATMKTQALVADISYAVGAAGLITGFLLYPKGPPPGAISAVSVVPTGRGAVAVLEGTW